MALTSSQPDNNTSRKEDTKESITNIWTNTLYLTHKPVAATHWQAHTLRVTANTNLRQVNHAIMSTQTGANGPNSAQYASVNL